KIGGYIYLDNNENLESLQTLENVDITEVNRLEITNNASLSYCHNPNVCDYLSNFGNHRLIENNLGSCINAPAVYTACGIEMSTQDQNYLGIDVYTNTNKIYVKAQDQIREVIIYDMTGKIVYQKNNINSTEFEHTLFSKGLFIVKIIKSKG